MQRLRYSFRNVAFNPKDISQLSVVSVSPDMGIGLRVDQLHIDPDLATRLLHATFKNVRYAQLLRDVGEIARPAVISLRGGTRDHF